MTDSILLCVRSVAYLSFIAAYDAVGLTLRIPAFGSGGLDALCVYGFLLTSFESDPNYVVDLESDISNLIEVLVSVFSSLGTLFKIDDFFLFLQVPDLADAMSVSAIVMLYL